MILDDDEPGFNVIWGGCYYFSKELISYKEHVLVHSVALCETLALVYLSGE